MSNVINVQEPNLISFVDRIQDLVQQGYVVSKTNKGVPQSFGFGVWVCQMVKEDSKQAEKTQEPVESSEKPSEKTSEEPEQTPKEDEKVEQSASQEVSEQSEETTTEEKPKTRRGRRKSTSK